MTIVEGPEEIKMMDENNYIYAVCMCPVPTSYAIKIKRRKSPDGKPLQYEFKCKSCGLIGVIIG